MINSDEYLERIVAGIHSVTTNGADVAWNEVVNGRQFDVVVRFKLGTLSYLVLVEVKNKTRKASASDLDAFVLKARDQNANKSVFVTAAGFQSGAIDVAKRHGVDLFTVTFDENAIGTSKEMSFLTLTRRGAPQEPPHWKLGQPNLVNQIERTTLVYADGREFDIPDEPSQATYYAMKSYLSDRRTLHELVQTLPIPNGSLDERHFRTYAVDLVIQPPDDFCFPAGQISALKLVVVAKLGRPIQGNVRIDPSLFCAPVIYRNVITGEETRFSLSSLPLGMQRVSVGSFYFIVHPLIYYHCDSISEGLVTWTVVESFQNGELIQAILTQRVEYSPHYIPVRDKDILKRLNARLEILRRRASK
jgi:Restriction endonuclease